MSHISSIVVEVRDKTLKRLGQVTPEDLNLTVTDVFNGVGSWILTLSPSHAMADALTTEGAGILITTSDGSSLFSGPMDKFSLNYSKDTPGGTLVIEGVSDTVILADRLGYPQPSNADVTTQNVPYDWRTAMAAESLMHALVSDNVGPTAPSARRDTRLTMGTDGGHGASLAKQVKFQQLGQVLGEISDLSQQYGSVRIGFRVVQVGDVLQFQTFVPNDQSAVVRFDVLNGMLDSQGYTEEAATLTRAIVGHTLPPTTDGADGPVAYTEVSNAASTAAETAWARRIESFIDQGGTDNDAEVLQAGYDALAQNGDTKYAAQVVPAEDITVEFGSEWNLGDVVSVVVNGQEVKDIVTGYVLKSDSDGFRMGAVLGDPAIAVSTPGRTRPPSSQTPMPGGTRFPADTGSRSLDARVSYLEKTRPTVDLTPLSLRLGILERGGVKTYDDCNWGGEGGVGSGAAISSALWSWHLTDAYQDVTELQNYVQNNSNASYNNFGSMVITAIKGTSGSFNYSSARLQSTDLFLFGLFEARIKIPTEVGAFPAFWLVGEDNFYGWPVCGEIDIMEAPVQSGMTSSTIAVHGGIHGPKNTAPGTDVPLGALGSSGITGYADGSYHTYAVDWHRDGIDWYIDNKLVGAITRSSYESATGVWVFNKTPMKAIVNVAVGGWAGTPDPAWSSSHMSIDYVRLGVK